VNVARALGLSAALGLPAASAQDLVPNGHFHTDVSAWTFAGTRTRRRQCELTRCAGSRPSRNDRLTRRMRSMPT
jgi:hypothetical protein